MANLNDLDDVTISNPKAGDVVKYTAQGWTNASDSTGTPPGGNPCGDLDHYTRDDKQETITEPWHWDVQQSEEGIDITNPEGVGEILGDRVRFTNDKGAASYRVMPDGNARLLSTNILSFGDDQVQTPVTLAQLVASGSGGGGGTNVGDPSTFISGEFTFNDSTDPYSQSLNDWLNFTGGSGQDARFLNYAISDDLAITLPEWATGAVVIYTQADWWRFSDNISQHELYGTGTPVVFRQYFSHRVEVLGAEFVVGNLDPSTPKTWMANLCCTNVTTPITDGVIADGARLAFAETTNYQVLKLPTPVVDRTIQFKQVVDFLGGGWQRFTNATGKMIVIPIIYDAFNIQTFNSKSANTYVGSTPEEYQEILDEIFPPYSSDDVILKESAELKQGIVYALNVCNDALAENPGDSTIEGIRSNLFALKTETSLSFAKARYKVLVGELAAAVAWKFDWEPAGYSLIGG